MRNMMEIIRDLSPLRMAPNSSGADECARILKEELPFEVHEFLGGAEVNGWVCPMKWDPKVGTIFDSKNNLIYDGMWHPLAIIGYSQSFKGEILGSELKKHLFYPDAFDDALVYHCDLFYKPFRKEWGFSVTKNFFNSINDKDFYSINLETIFEQGTMKVLEYNLPGDTTDTIIMNAHNCHAFCCNDDLSGVAVGIEIIRELSKLKHRRYTYKLIIGPEHFGSIFYLNKLPDAELEKLKCGVFLEMLGHGGCLALQRTFVGNTILDKAFINVLKHSGKKWRTDLFRKIVGNDETCWEGAGYEIPFASISRSLGKGHFPEYHTSKDSPDIIDIDMMNGSVQITLGAFDIIEKNAVISRNFKGLVALSNPKFNLYKPFYDPSEPDRKIISDDAFKWNYLMDCLPRYFNEDIMIIEISERHEISFSMIYNYVIEFELKDLIKIIFSKKIQIIERKIPPN